MDIQSRLCLLLGTLALLATEALAQPNRPGFPEKAETPYVNKAYQKFAQLGTDLPTANNYRTASGAPGHNYWQNQADYDIKVELNDEKQQIIGQEVITYTNRSPDVLRYVWVQLDQNILDKESDTYKTQTGKLADRVSTGQMQGSFDRSFDGGHKISYVRDAASGQNLTYTIVKTMMRVELARSLGKDQVLKLGIGWSYNVNDRNNPALSAGSRGGCEFFAEDGNWLYSITQWFPRMAVYDDYNGWQHKQFLGTGEFTLPFGNYSVAITVPADHVVGATGECQNYAQVLSKTELARYEQAKTATKPVVIVTQDEATQKEKTKVTAKKTWVYKATNVRDFAFTSSRKHIWDAMGVKIAGKTVMAMSYYPKEGNPLWGQYSTEVVAHTLRTYSRYSFDYPYPVAISVEASNGMEYPMICFNYGRPEKDGTYSDRIKYGMISVIIHEVGHNFFPMIVNSDERQWTWMDEGLNTFLQYLSEQEWDRNYPSGRGAPRKIVEYMKADPNILEPIMTNSESVQNLGANAYAKAATGLSILRETVMGRELFDYAFREYSRRWMFKHPTPADFFRTMEDASGIDLDWFWRGWFYTTDYCDIAIDNVTEAQMSSGDPAIEKPLAKQREQFKELYQVRNERDIARTAVEANADLRDFYNSYDPYVPTKSDQETYQRYLASLNEKERAMLKDGKYFYQIDFKNVGELVMPLVLEFEFEDGTKQEHRIPAEIWRRNDKQVSKVFMTDKRVKQFTLDPYQETADIEMDNNYFPRRSQPSRFQLFKQSGGGRGQSFGENPMQRQKKEANPTPNGGGK
ncbi:MAG: M1 family metallopeptidase [Bernardetiaceae bacterium]|jgi:hypothetical protein|nr:M1 family metallopeptidase [Bernardetiaceae bacterium]